MAAAEVGDDVFGDDPTVNALEARAAELLGKDAGLFVSSGTQGNLVSLMAHLPRGYEAIAGATTHTVIDEAGGHAVVVGATIRALQERPGRDHRSRRDRRRLPRPERPPRADHRPRHPREHARPHAAAGRCRSTTSARWRRSPTSAACRSTSTARGSSTPSVALGVTPARARGARRQRDVLPVQGPVGADRLRRRRQRRRSSPARGARASCSAAACARSACSRRPGCRPSATARRHGMIARLAEDHANARRLAEGLAGLDGIRSPGRDRPAGRLAPLDPARAVTNFVLFRWTATGPRSSPPSRRGACCMVAVRARRRSAP